jgi:1,3-beta-glucan synthase
VTLIPYLFINAQTGVAKSEQVATNSLVRVGIVALAPIGINAGVAAMFFAMACCMGPLLSMCCKKFGSVLAAIAHAIAVIALLAMFEVMYFLQRFDFAKTLLGMIVVVALQRFIVKLIITLALTREFKTDQSNIAFWTGKWYSMGWHSMSQPAREYLCKITELSLFAADFVLGHIILFFMVPFVLVPQIDKLHSMMLFWLRPSRQIRPPIYSMKQTKLRRRRVIRYAVLYFVLLVVFLALIVGPSVAGKYVPDSMFNMLKDFKLVQPTGLDNNDTRGTSATGTDNPSHTIHR